MRTITKFILIAIAIMGIAWLIPGVEVVSFTTALWVALLLAILNLIVKPILIVLTIPVTILTFGLFLLVINGLIIWMAGAWVRGFFVETFWKAILFSILLSAATYLIEQLLGPPPPSRRVYHGETRSYRRE
ncbi:MAG: phage holin family protein [Marinilabiliales bacterium]|nr:MAG: phage holin family protein [Marinilabiliales bacterium]